VHPAKDVWEGNVDIQSSHYVTGDTAFAVDRRGVIILWNKAAEESLGFSAKQALGQKCWKLLAGKDAYGNRYCCKHCPVREMSFRHEPVNSFHSTFNTESGEPRQFHVSCLTIFDDPGSNGKSNNELLLHICCPEDETMHTEVTRALAASQLGALSQREIEVLALLAKKVSTKNIADRLEISIRTVRTHIQHLMYKLQVHKRIEAIKVGKHLNLI